MNTEQASRADTLREVGRMSYQLPAPQQVSFQADILSIRFDTAQDALRWSEHLGSDGPPVEQTYQPDWRRGPIHNVTAFALWRGYRVQLHGWTPVGGESGA